MQPHEIITLYATKPLEYAVAILYLLVFAAFWHYVNSDARAGAGSAERAWSGALAEWFHVPEQVFFHPGHAWAKALGQGVVAIGVDDFAQALVGPLKGVTLPKPGDPLAAGQRAWQLAADSKAVDMLSPVTGTVLEVNQAALDHADIVNADPFGNGWLLKVRVADAKDALQQLTSGDAARRWMGEVSDRLMGAMTPQLGHVLQDGGMPVHGIARAMDEARWDEIARTYLLS
jgi:glycine cleavage system H protein